MSSLKYFPSISKFLKILRYQGLSCDHRNHFWPFTRYSRTSLSGGICRRNSSLSSNDIYACKQLHRSLIRLSGSETSVFLQGLITNDMRHFENNDNDLTPRSIYALMLNHQGRVLYDIIIYDVVSDKDNVEFLLECDSRVVNDVYKHLKLYRLRRKVDIAIMEKDLNVWTVFQHQSCSTADAEQMLDLSRKIFSNDNTEVNKVISSTMDPRVGQLGLRIVASDNAAVEAIANSRFQLKITDEDIYHELRYKLGIAEGIKELPPGSCLPLECNADYTHGVSFHKGCYIGQELTARTHHTGVVRKRILPLVLKEEAKDLNAEESSLVTEDGKKVGKVYGILRRHGIGLLRIQECLNSNKKLILRGSECQVSVTTNKPFWWPREASKENSATIGNN